MSTQCSCTVDAVNGKSLLQSENLVNIVNNGQSEIKATEISVEAVKTFDNSISINPNPVTSTSIITATVADKTENATLVITNTQGKAVKSYKLHSGFNKIEITNKEIGSGTYYFTLQISGKNTITKSIVVIE